MEATGRRSGKQLTAYIATHGPAGAYTDSARLQGLGRAATNTPREVVEMAPAETDVLMEEFDLR